jgi:hypothetical protein
MLNINGKNNNAAFVGKRSHHYPTCCLFLWEINFVIILLNGHLISVRFGLLGVVGSPFLMQTTQYFVRHGMDSLRGRVQ